MKFLRNSPVKNLFNFLVSKYFFIQYQQERENTKLLFSLYCLKISGNIVLLYYFTLILLMLFSSPVSDSQCLGSQTQFPLTAQPLSKSFIYDLFKQIQCKQLQTSMLTRGQTRGPTVHGCSHRYNGSRLSEAGQGRKVQGTFGLSK